MMPRLGHGDVLEQIEEKISIILVDLSWGNSTGNTSSQVGQLA
jgi:hypothetical protein